MYKSRPELMEINPVPIKWLLIGSRINSWYWIGGLEVLNYIGSNRQGMGLSVFRRTWIELYLAFETSFKAEVVCNIPSLILNINLNKK